MRYLKRISYDEKYDEQFNSLDEANQPRLGIAPF